MEIKKRIAKKQTAKKQTAKDLQNEVGVLVKKLKFDDGGLIEEQSSGTAEKICEKLDKYYQGNFSLWSNFNELWVAVRKQATRSALSAVHTIIMNATVAPYWSKVKKGMLTALRIEDEEIKKNLQIIYENETAPKNRIKGQAPKQNLKYIENIENQRLKYIEDIKKQIKDVIQKLTFNNDGRCLMSTNQSDVQYVYQCLNLYYEFNPTDRKFRCLWDEIHREHLVKPNETNSKKLKPKTQLDIMWRAIFNATVASSWCNKSGGMIPLLRRSDLKRAFELIKKEKEDTEFFKNANFNKNQIPDSGSLTGDD